MRIKSKLLMPRKSKFLSILIFIPISIYVFEVFNSNFQVDDYGSVSMKTLSLQQHISDWRYLWGMRPVGMILLPSMIEVFQSHPVLYNLTNLTIYSSSLILLIKIMFWTDKRNLSYIGIPALALGLLPAIADTFIHSPVNQMCQSISLLFFVIGLQLQYQKNKSQNRVILPMLFYCFSFLTYEIWMPLLILSFLNPILLTKLSFKELNLRRMTPGLMALTITLIWQKFLVIKFFGATNSRLEGFSVSAFVSYFYVWIVEFPVKLFLSCLARPEIFIAIFLTLTAIYLIERNSRNIENTNISSTPYILCFLAMAFLYSISGKMATTFGYDNRGMTASWVIFSILVCVYCSGKKRFLVFLLISCNSVYFLNTFIDFRDASKVRNVAIQETVGYLDKLKKVDSDFSSGPIILYANVLCANQDGINRPSVFCVTWDMGPAINISSNLNVTVYPIQNMVWGDPPKVQRDGGLESIDGVSVFISYDNRGHILFTKIFRSEDDLNLYLAKKYDLIYKLLTGADVSSSCKFLRNIAEGLQSKGINNQLLWEKFFHNGFCRVYFDPKSIG